MIIIVSLLGHEPLLNCSSTQPINLIGLVVNAGEWLVYKYIIYICSVPQVVAIL